MKNTAVNTQDTPAVIGLELHSWALRAQPTKDPTGLLGEKFWDQIRFVGNQLHPLFLNSHRHKKSHPVRVVGTYRNIGDVLLPVYSISAPCLEIRFSGDFTKWIVSVRSLDQPVPDIFLDLIDRDLEIPKYHCLGFPEGWALGTLRSNPNKFTVRLHGVENFQFFTFMYLLSEGLQVRSRGALTRFNPLG